MKTNHRARLEKHPQAVQRDDQIARDRAEGRAGRAEPRDQQHVERDGEDRCREPELQRRACIAGRAKRGATMKPIIIPPMPTNMMRKNGSASCCTAGAALTTLSSAGAASQPTTPMIAARPSAVSSAW